MRVVAGVTQWVAAALCALAVYAGDALATPEKRVALIIGNSDYSAVPKLRNPVRDAADIAAALQRIGFEVSELHDLDDRGMRLALRDFSSRAEEADVALVYFAGHGIEIENTNYLIPVNAELKSSRDVEFEAIRLSAVLSAVEGSSGLKIVLVDACRDNPFQRQMQVSGATRSLGRGLARIEPSGVVVGYAAKGGTLASDGSGRNSPYASALLRHIETPGLELGKLFRLVRDTVFAATAGGQEPFVYGSLPGRDIFLVPPRPQPAVVAAPAPRPGPLGIEQEMVEAFAEAAELNTEWVWKRFIERFGDHPDHRLVVLAAKRQEALSHALDLRRGFRISEPWLELNQDASGNIVLTAAERRQIQDALNMMGFDTGGIDGQFGLRTRQAIAQARFKAKLPGGTGIDYPLLRVLPNAPRIRSLMPEQAERIALADMPDDLEPRLRKALTALRFYPVLFDYYQGNLYFAVHATGMPWDSINRLASEAGGHLVTISSAAENQFIVDLFSRDPRFTHEENGTLYGPSIGLFQADRRSEPAGGWAWVTGEPFTYRRWSPGNPDNYMQRQHYARFFLNADRRRSFSRPHYWDDASGDTWETGLILEIE